MEVGAALQKQLAAFSVGSRCHCFPRPHGCVYISYPRLLLPPTHPTHPPTEVAAAGGWGVVGGARLVELLELLQVENLLLFLRAARRRSFSATCWRRREVRALHAPSWGRGGEEEGGGNKQPPHGSLCNISSVLHKNQTAAVTACHTVRAAASAPATLARSLARRPSSRYTSVAADQTQSEVSHRDSTSVCMWKQTVPAEEECAPPVRSSPVSPSCAEEKRKKIAASRR